MRTLVAIDLSPASDEALRQGTPSEALAVCHVIPNLHSVRPLFPHLALAESQLIDDLPRRAAEAISARVETVTGLAPSAYETFIDTGVDYAEIARRAEAWKADRIVVGAHGVSGLASILGGVAERVVRCASCPVLVARPGKSDGPVIAATDLSDPSVPAIAAAVEESRRRGAPLVVVHAMDFGDATMIGAALAPFGVGPVIPASAIDETRALAQQVIEGHLEALGAKGEVVIGNGPASSVIVRLAEQRGAGLLVVGTRGRTGIAHLALGSVAERVIRAASCSVLAVRLAGS